eukprot:3763975-Pyramimonas_sp.AAC.1
MYKWTESSHCRGDKVDVPDVLPDWWLHASTRALRAAQEDAQRLYGEATTPPTTVSASVVTRTDAPTDKSDILHHETIRVRRGHEHILETASGDRVANEHIKLKLSQIGFSSSAMAMTDCPSVLSVGQLVQEDGLRQLWDPTLGYLLPDPRGQ